MRLLDDVKVEKGRMPVFSILAIVSPVLMILLLGYIGYTLEYQEEVPYEWVMFFLIIGLLLFGTLSLGLCFVRKEKPIFLRWIATFIYFLMIAIFIIIVVYDL